MDLSLLIDEPIKGSVANSSERVKRYRLKQKELGRLKREMYLTNAEYSELKITLINIRKTLTIT